MKWQFDTIYGREDDVSNPLIEMFEGDYNYYLAREVLQNALDAKPIENEGPVLVRFGLEFISKHDFPGYDDFYKIINSAKRFWPTENLKTHKFLQTASEYLEIPKIPVLRISDFNTTGLWGMDNDRNSPWYKLIRSVGSTSKHGGQGGSYGLGKGAPFASSALRTIFYSTKTSEHEFSFQGVSEIVSHLGEDNNVKRGSGSFGEHKQNSIRNESNIPSFFRRSEIGLDLFVMGYKVSENWDTGLVDSVLRNFWPAIQDELLEVEINDYSITKDTIGDLLVKRFGNKGIKDHAEPAGNPLRFYLAYVTGEEHRFDDLENLNSARFYFSEIEQHLNRVAMIRKSKMVIYTREFRWHSPFAGVFICDDIGGNMELRKMETPQHDKWDPSRYSEKGIAINNEITNSIRQVLRNKLNDRVKAELDIPGIENLLPLKDSNANTTDLEGYNGEGNVNETESAVEEAKEEAHEKNIFSSPTEVFVLNEESKGSTGQGNLKRKGPTKGSRKTKGSKGGGKGAHDSNVKRELNVRSFLSQESDSTRTYCVVPYEGLKLRKIGIIAVGEEFEEPISIVSAWDVDGRKLVVEEGGFVKIESLFKSKIYVQLKLNYKVSIKVVGYEVQQ